MLTVAVMLCLGPLLQQIRSDVLPTDLGLREGLGLGLVFGDEIGFRAGFVLGCGYACGYNYGCD